MNLHDTERQFIRYVFSGFIAVAVHFAVLMVLVESGQLPKTLASISFRMVSFSLLGLQHPEPNGSRRATPTSTFQHRAGHSPVNYLIQYHLVFRSTGRHAEAFGRYVTVTLVTLVVNGVFFGYWCR